MTESELLEAVQYGETEEVQAGLKEGLDPNYSEEDHDYPLLQWAAQGGHVDIIKLLVRFGADVNAVEGGGLTALHNAAGDGNLEVVQTLIECGADVNRMGSNGTALMTAAAYGNRDVVQLMLNRGANPNALDKNGHSPLLFAVSNGRSDVAEVLTTHGAKKYVSDDSDLPRPIRVRNAVLQRFDEVRFERLSPEEQVVASVATLMFEVDSQGLRLFYFGAMGQHTKETVAALERVGAKHSAELLRQANSLFEEGGPDPDESVRRQQLGRETPLPARLEELTSSFYDDADGLSALLSAFIEEHIAELPQP